MLASAGIGSRRACEDLIAAGRVMVDGQVVRELGVRVDPAAAVVGRRDARASRRPLVYLALNKPKGVVSTMRDDRGPPVRRRLRRRPRTDRLFHVGRLDAETEGLLLLTNDGELAHRLTHPSYEVPKTYLAEVAGAVPRDLGKRLRAGIELEDGPVKVDSFRLVDSRRASGAGRGRAARGPQARRPPAAGRGRAPGRAAGPHRRSARSTWATCAAGGPAAPGPAGTGHAAGVRRDVTSGIRTRSSGCWASG